MNAFCPHCNQKYDVDANMFGQTADCTACGKEFTINKPPVPSPPPSLPQSKTKSAQPAGAKPPVTGLLEPEPARLRIPTGALLAAILCALWALVTTALALRSLLVEGAGESYLDLGESGVLLVAIWNMMISSVYVLFCIRILSLDWRWGWEWPFGTNILNAILSLVYIISSLDSDLDLEAEAIGGFTILIELAIVALLFFNKKHFKKPETA